jgi:5-methyltetrahydrofolate--homocysteine methyltransferase
MIIIGERILATRKRIGKAVAERDEKHIRREARVQTEAGATYIDCNAGRNPASEVEDMKWLIGCVQAEVDTPISIDSANPDAIAAGLNLVRKTPIINSVTAEKDHIARVMPLAARSGAMLVSLCRGDGGMPTSGLDDRLKAAETIVKAAEEAGITVDRLIFDPAIMPVSIDPSEVRAAIEAVRRIMTRWPGTHTTCGLSNVSFGLPCRNVLNRTYLAMLIEAGLDGAILDPTEPHMMSTVLAAEALAGRDEYCMEYIKAGRADRLD